MQHVSPHDEMRRDRSEIDVMEPQTVTSGLDICQCGSAYSLRFTCVDSLSIKASFTLQDSRDNAPSRQSIVRTVPVEAPYSGRQCGSAVLLAATGSCNGSAGSQALAKCGLCCAIRCEHARRWDVIRYGPRDARNSIGVPAIAFRKHIDRDQARGL